ncbi:MAG: hypothetical protein UHK60_04050 [Acutalibacteraceae bacterium]|nr:hypothetical protein [Acutalibacteraceae bacterium]
MATNNFTDYNTFLENNIFNSTANSFQEPLQSKHYKKYKAFEIIISVLAVVILVENMFFILERTILKHNQYFVVFSLAITVATIVFSFLIYYLYKKLSLDFSLRDLKIFTATEIILIICEIFIVTKPSPVLLILILIYFVLFTVYLFVFSTESVKPKAISSIAFFIFFLIMFTFRAVDVKYTARYFYFSENGYSNAENTDTSYFHKEPISLEDYESCLEILNTYAHQTIPMNNNYFSSITFPKINGLSMQEIFKNLNNYDESFFNDNCIELTVVELKNPNDRIDCKHLYAANGYSDLSLTYNSSDIDSNSKALCVILLECSDNQSDVLYNMYSIKSEFANISYK